MQAHDTLRRQLEAHTRLVAAARKEGRIWSYDLCRWLTPEEMQLRTEKEETRYRYSSERVRNLKPEV